MIMATSLRMISTLAPVTLTFLVLCTTLVVHAAPIVPDNCPTGCDQFPGSLGATFLFGDLATPLGYKQVTAICPGTEQARDCQRIATPPDFYDPAAPTFRCCDKFRIVTGSYFFQTSVDIKNDENIRVSQYRYSRRTEQLDWQDNQYIGCIEGPPVDNPYQQLIFDSPVVIPVGSPVGINYTRITEIEACYYPYNGPLPPPPPPPGSVTGDPKVVGGDGVVFYFHGRKDHNFCLVSDSDLHVNAHFIGKRPAGRTRDFTWVQALGFVYGSHTLTIAAKRVANWDNAIDHLEFIYNGEALALNLESLWTSPGGVMTLKRTSATNSVDLEIKEKMGVSLNAVPIGKHESDVHHYGITSDDCFAHMDMQFRFYNLSAAVDGVLGQTYQPGFVNPVTRGVAMPVMGGADRFASSSLLATDCAVSRYTATAAVLESATPSLAAACGSSGLAHGFPGAITCRR
ncbi:hypothetical protein M758_12G112900 [Ceratodon purpureus]|nr:hypothetical protein M758_12G112900 [Ceratodon purpureus]